MIGLPDDDNDASYLEVLKEPFDALHPLFVNFDYTDLNIEPAPPRPSKFPSNAVDSPAI